MFAVRGSDAAEYVPKQGTGGFLLLLWQSQFPQREAVVADIDECTSRAFLHCLCCKLSLQVFSYSRIAQHCSALPCTMASTSTALQALLQGQRADRIAAFRSLGAQRIVQLESDRSVGAVHGAFSVDFQCIYLPGPPRSVVHRQRCSINGPDSWEVRLSRP